MTTEEPPGAMPGTGPTAGADVAGSVFGTEPAVEFEAGAATALAAFVALPRPDGADAEGLEC